MENSLNQVRPRRREYSKQFKAEVLGVMSVFVRNQNPGPKFPLSTTT